MGEETGRTCLQILLFPPSLSHGVYPALETDKEVLADVLVSKAKLKPG